MSLDLYAATIAPASDGTERLWLGDAGAPYYLTLNRLFYKNAAGRMFTDLTVNIDNGTGGALLLGDGTNGLNIQVVDGASATLNVPSATFFTIQATNGSIANSGGSSIYFSWNSSGAVGTFANSSGVKIKDTDNSHTLGLVLGANLTANRTFTLTTPNGNCGLDLSAVSGVITLSIDGTLAGNSDSNIPTQKAVKTYVDTAVTGLMDFKGSTDCSANPNYPAASKGDAYVVSVAGKIGGASGTSVDVGDVYLAKADNAGGTQAAVGTSWTVLEHNLAGALLAANNLSDLASASTARSNLGVAIGSQVQAWDADLDAIAALVSAADKGVYATGAQAWAVYSLTQSGRALGGVAWSAGTQIPALTAAGTASLKTVGSAAGNILDKAAGDALYQPLDTDLTTIAGLTATTDNFIVSVASAWASRTPAQVRTVLAGTSGATFPLLNAANTWSAAQTFSNGIGVSGVGGASALYAVGAGGGQLYVDLAGGGGNYLDGITHFRSGSGTTAFWDMNVAGCGYVAGSGGAVTQATSKSTGVTLNKPTGQITLNGAALNAGTSVSFTLTNSSIAATDAVILTIGSGATADTYTVMVTATAAGSCRIQVQNFSITNRSEALVLNFAVIKGAVT